MHDRNTHTHAHAQIFFFKKKKTTYEAQQQSCGEKSPYWGGLEDDVNHLFGLDLAKMSVITYILVSNLRSTILCITQQYAQECTMNLIHVNQPLE